MKYWFFFYFNRMSSVQRARDSGHVLQQRFRGPRFDLIRAQRRHVAADSGHSASFASHPPGVTSVRQAGIIIADHVVNSNRNSTTSETLIVVVVQTRTAFNSPPITGGEQKRWRCATLRNSARSHQVPGETWDRRVPVHGTPEARRRHLVVCTQSWRLEPLGQASSDWRHGPMSPRVVIFFFSSSSLAVFQYCHSLQYFVSPVSSPHTCRHVNERLAKTGGDWPR